MWSNSEKMAKNAYEFLFRQTEASKQRQSVPENRKKIGSICPDELIRLAIECKNIRENFPIIVSCVPRRIQESYHEVVYYSEIPIEIEGEEELRNTISLRLYSKASVYKSDENVGKSIAQVGQYLENKKKNVFGTDAHIFDKWAQALASAQNLADRAFEEKRKVGAESRLSAIFPILVVPDNMLWIANYDNYGKLRATPSPTDKIDLFVGRPYSSRGRERLYNLSVSHLEIKTKSALEDSLITKFIKESDKVFPKDAIESNLLSLRENGRYDEHLP